MRRRVGPNWKGETPADITAVVRSSTQLAFVAPRIFMDDTAEDRKAIQPLVSQVVFYPLSQFDGKMKTKDYSKLPHFRAPKSDGKGETKWVTPEKFFEELPAAMKAVPPLPGEQVLYGWVNSVWEVAAKDPATKQALVESVVAADKEIIAPLILWNTTAAPQATAGTRRGTMRGLVPTISIAPPLPSRTSMRTGQTRRSTFTRTTTARVSK